MTQLDYAEAWLWVHFLLEGSGDSAGLVSRYLASLRQGEPPAPLSATLAERLGGAAAADAAVVAHLQSLARSARMGNAVQANHGCGCRARPDQHLFAHALIIPI